MISINTNISASRGANELSRQYGRLQTSAQRLSSGLRINSAADDAAGLGIRELMRSDIAALNQGVRNVNDAISMLQTMDAALGVIDEKLIRMKELAEQAATGTYDSTQRLMIDSEFQAMGSEIDRIARATDFNGVKLLTAPMTTWYTTESRFVVTDPGSVSNETFPTGNPGNVVLNRVNANNFINAANPQKTINVSLTAKENTNTIINQPMTVVSHTTAGNQVTTTYALAGSPYNIAYMDAIGNASGAVFSYNYDSADPATPDTSGFRVTDNNGTYPTVSPSGTILSAMNPGANFSAVQLTISDNQGNGVDFNDIANSNIKSFNIDTQNGTFSMVTTYIDIDVPANAEYTAAYDPQHNTVTVRLNNGGTATVSLADALDDGDTITFDITFEGEQRDVQVPHHSPDPDAKLKIHFGPGNDSAEDYYYINYQNCTREGLGLEDVRIATQESAQEVLVTINDAIVTKDKARAYFGTMQNRLENTMQVNIIQSENLQAAESRISDADIATEMMMFVRNQILTQSAVAMLAQANSMPQMVMRLVG